LERDDGQTAYIEVECLINEATIPATFGPILDIDSQGGLETTDCSTSYKLLPVRLALSFETAHGSLVRRRQLVLGSDS
jgi:hypothetical protein